MAGRVFEDVVEPEEEDVIEAAASFVVKVEPPKSSDVRMGGRPEPIVEMFFREAGEETGMAKGFEVFTSSIILFMLLDDKTKADDVSNNKINKLNIYIPAHTFAASPPHLWFITTSSFLDSSSFLFPKNLNFEISLLPQTCSSPRS